MFAAYAKDEEIARFVTWRPHATASESEAVIDHFLDSWRQGREFHWLVFLRGSNTLMGAAGLRKQEHQLELGYVLARRYWGRGYMTEAIAALVDWAFTEPSVFRVGAVCDTDNRRSARLLERAGFEREGILRSWAVHPNISPTPRDCYSYSRTRII
jgi:RimJ/RimL family protein N-acetyltransferase